MPQSSDLESLVNKDCSGRLIPKMLKASPSDIGNRELTPLLRPHSLGQICTPPVTNNTNCACLPSQQLLGKQIWQQPRPYHFPKTLNFFRGDFGYSFDTTDFTTWRISSLLMDIKSIFRQFRLYFLQIHYISSIIC